MTRAEHVLPGSVHPLCWRCQKPITLAIETTACLIRGVNHPVHGGGCVPALTPQPRKEQA